MCLNDDLVKKKTQTLGEGTATIEVNDPNTTYIEVRYNKAEYVEAALKMNLQEYKLNNVMFVVGVKVKERKIGTYQKVDAKVIKE